MIDIPIEDIIELSNSGMSDRQIARYFTERGTKISANAIGDKIRKYYKNEKRQERPKLKGGRPKTDINEIEIFELKELGLTDKQIKEYLNKQGIDVDVVTVTRRLNSYYKSEGKIKPRIEFYNKLGKEECDEAIAYIKEVLKKAKENEVNLSNSGEER